MEPIVGLLTIELHVPDAMSLKDKRSVVSSLMGRVSNKFNVAVAEVDALDSHRLAVIAMTTVANDLQHVTRVLDTVLDFVERDPRAVVEDSQVEYF